MRRVLLSALPLVCLTLLSGVAEPTKDAPQVRYHFNVISPRTPLLLKGEHLFAGWKDRLWVFDVCEPEAPLRVAELKLSGLINELVNLTIGERDHATNIFLPWFVTEQVEEEASANEVVQKVKMGGDGNGLFMLDRELAQRVFTPPHHAAGGGTQ